MYIGTSELLLNWKLHCYKSDITNSNFCWETFALHLMVPGLCSFVEFV